MTVSLPANLKSFVDQQFSARGYSSSSEYIRELIRQDRGCQRLCGLLFEGAVSSPAVTADADYVSWLRRPDREARPAVR